VSNLRGGEALVGRLAVLAREIADLTGSGSRSIAGRSLAAHERIHVGASGRAVAVSRNGVVVDVVHSNHD
jgi:hypothetical protein